MTDVEEIKRRLAELEEKKKVEKKRNLTGKEKMELEKQVGLEEPYGKELKSKPEPKPVKVEEENEPEEEPEVDEKAELERFSGEQVNLTQEEFNVLMKLAEIGKQAVQTGVIPSPKKPPKIVSQEPVEHKEPETLGEEIEMSKEQELPEGAFEDVAPKKKRRWFRRGGKPSEYAGEDRVTSGPTILYYDTDNTCKLVTGKINRDGSLQIDERLFDFAEGQPSILSIQKGRGRSSSHPFYILRYDNMHPIDITDYPDSNPTPEQASRLIELGTLETLSKIEGGKLRKGPLIILMLVAFFGGFVLKMMLSLLGIW